MSSNNLCQIVFPEGQQEGTKSFVARWLKRTGDAVKEHEPVLEISTDKVTMEIAAPATGILQEILKPEDSETGPGDLLGLIAPGGVVSASVQKQPQDKVEAINGAEINGGEQRLSPAVRKLLSENGISVDQITGSGREGRITHQDVAAFLAARESGAVSGSWTGSPTSLSSRRVPHTPMRKTIAKHMVESMLHTAPHVTSVFDCNLEAVIAHRERERKSFEDRGVRLTFTAYFVQAAAKALSAVPEVNSRFHNDALEIFESCNIGVATSLEKEGLIVPVVRDAAKLDLFAIAEALQDLTTRARSGQLSPADLQGGTFTITNHGTSGSLIATPIISQPQSAILGIGKLERRPCVVNRDGRESIEPQSRVYVTLTIDHRALDGFVANLFLTEFVRTLESF